MNETLTLIIGATGFAIGLLGLWRYRSQIRRSWDEALRKTPTSSAADSSAPSYPRQAAITKTRLTLAFAIVLICVIGSVLVAVLTKDGVIRLVYILLAAILFAGLTGLLPWQFRKRSHRNS